MTMRPRNRLALKPLSGAPRQSRPAGRGRSGRVLVVEVLEGRALLSGAAIDPTFNGGQAVVNPIVPTDGSATTLNNGSADAVQTDGKILVLGNYQSPGSTVQGANVLLRRYKVDGSLDSSFGTSGQVSVALPGGSYNAAFPSRDLVILPGGKILFTADLAQSVLNVNAGGFSYVNLETVVVQLNPDGSPDTTFGTSGQTIIADSAANLTQLARQMDGKIILGGTATPSGATTPAIAATRLNADGSVDTSFHGGTLLTLDPNVYGSAALQTTLTLADLALTPAGQVVLVYTGETSVNSYTSTYQVVEITTNGAVNTSFGTAGLVRGPASPDQSVAAAAVQTDGKIVLAGTSLTRLNSDGTVDSSFTNPVLPFAASSIMVQADGKILMGAASGFLVTRYTASGRPDGSYGPLGQSKFSFRAVATNPPASGSPRVINDLALTSTGQVVAVGTLRNYSRGLGTFGGIHFDGASMVLVRLKSSAPVSGDYDGDGVADIAAQLSDLTTFAIRKSTGGDSLNYFGINGVGQTIPAPGDYDGDGITDIAGYLPAYGVLAYRPSSGGTDVVIQFGPAGVGASIPAPGDYDGDGVTDIAVYIPSMGAFAIRPSSGVANYFAPFGTAGPGGSIPAPGDYDGDGVTDLAVYLPAIGTFAYRVRSRNAPYELDDILVGFGTKGPGASIPVPGDYDGDGKTDVAVYLTGPGSFAIFPSGGTAITITPFGTGGLYQSVPTPGDYDGDGVTDLSVYLPNRALYAYRSSAGKGDVIQGFGAPGLRQTIPAASITAAQPTGGSATNAMRVSQITPSASVFMPLTDDLTSPTTTRKKKSTA